MTFKFKNSINVGYLLSTEMYVVKVNSKGSHIWQNLWSINEFLSLTQYLTLALILWKQQKLSKRKILPISIEGLALA